MTSGKQIAKNTLFLYIRMFIVVLVTLYTVRVVINTLGVVDYGVFTAVGGIVLMMSFLSQTITFAAQRYFSMELGRNDLKRLKEVFSSVLLIYVVIAVFVSLIAEFVGIWFLENKMLIPENRMEAAHWVLHFSLLSFVVSIFYTPFNAIIIAHEKMDVYAFVSIFEFVLKLIIVFIIPWCDYDRLFLYAGLLLCVYVIVALVYIGYCLRYYEESRFCIKWNKSLVSELIGFSSWTMFGTLSGAANYQGTGLLLNMFLGPVANASHSIAHQVSQALQLFSSNVYTAVRPPMTKSYAVGDYDYVLCLFYKSSKYSYYLLLLMLLPLFFEMHFVLHVWLGTVSEYMVDFSRLLLIYVVIISMSYPISIIVQAAGRVKKYHGFVDGFTLLSLVVSYFVLLLGGSANMVFYTMIIVFLLAHLFRLVILYGIINYSYKDYLILFLKPVFLVSIMAVLPIWGIHTLLDESWTRFLSITVSSVLFIALFVYCFGIDKHEKEFVRKQICIFCR